MSIALLEGPADCEIVLDAGHLPDDVRRFFVERDIAGVVATVPTFVHPVLARHMGPPCVLRAGRITPTCTEGEHFCGVPVWRHFPAVERRI